MAVEIEAGEVRQLTQACAQLARVLLQIES
jgi:hypothetical protein